MSAKELPPCHSLYTILSDPMSGYVFTYQRYYSSLSVMLSCLSCQKESTNIQASSESPLEVCILTRRVVALCPWFHCFWVLVKFELYHHQTREWCGYHVPGPTRLGKMSKPLLHSRLRFCKPCSGNSGDYHVWKLATDPSLHSADGSFAADISRVGFSAAGLWKAPLDGPLTRVLRERWQLLALRSQV